MDNNFQNTVIAAIAATQDGQSLAGRNDEYSQFIMQKIEDNTTEGNVDVDELHSNFSYMIDQLKKACKPLAIYMDRTYKG